MVASWRDIERKSHPDFEHFVQTIACLRAPDGCPWDKEQTHESIARNMLEEAYEAVDAIEANDVQHMREELGDVLLQVVLQAQIAADAGEFNIDDVCRDVNEKIIRRHPHVFGDASADDSSSVLELWDQVKLQEKSASDSQAQAEGKERKYLLDGVPRSFPSLMQAQKISRKAVSVGFEWEDLDAVWAQVDEEIVELKQAYMQAKKDSRGKVTDDDQVALEMGDVLFSLVNIARKMGLDAEMSLRMTCQKFRQRFASMEDQAFDQEKRLENLSVEELEALWHKAKKAEMR